jgi:hypothetical protein
VVFLRDSRKVSGQLRGTGHNHILLLFSNSSFTNSDITLLNWAVQDQSLSESTISCIPSSLFSYVVTVDRSSPRCPTVSSLSRRHFNPVFTFRLTGSTNLTAAWKYGLYWFALTGTLLPQMCGILIACLHPTQQSL